MSSPWSTPPPAGRRSARIAAALAASVALGISACGGDTAPIADTTPAADTIAPAADTIAPASDTIAPAAGTSPAVAEPAGTPTADGPLAFTAPLVGGGTFDGAAYGERPVVLWFWVPT